MKSLAVKFNEAIAELKKKVSAKKYEKTLEECRSLPSIETKLNCVEAALGTLSESVNIEEAKRDYANLFGVEPRKATTNKESAAAPIVKHNGRIDNFNENNPLQRAEGKPVQMTETNKDVCTKLDKVTADGLLKVGAISEAEHSQLVGKKPAGYEKLTEKQRKEFDFARLIGISEADAFKVAKMSGSNLTEVSR